MKLLKIIKKMIINFIIILINTIRPFLGPRGCCRFEVSCTKYAKIQLQSNNILLALFNILKRILLCNPFSPQNFID